MVFGFFEKFDKGVCKAHLQMTIQRGRICKSKHVNTMKNLKREIAVLLREHKEEKARIKAEQYIQEEKMECALDILETLSELLITRLAFLDSQKECPKDLLNVVQSVIYCTGRMSIEELDTVTKQFKMKYGKEFVECAVYNRNAHVHFRLVQLLDVHPCMESEIHIILNMVAREFDVGSYLAHQQPGYDSMIGGVLVPPSAPHVESVGEDRRGEGAERGEESRVNVGEERREEREERRGEMGEKMLTNHAAENDTTTLEMLLEQRIKKLHQ